MNDISFNNQLMSGIISAQYEDINIKVTNNIVTKSAPIHKDDFHRLMNIDKSWPPRIVNIPKTKKNETTI